MAEGRGGAREGAGRKKTGYKAFNIRISEECIKHIKKRAKEQGISTGEVVMNSIKEG